MATASRMRECSPSKLEQPSSHAEMRNDADSLALALRLQEEEHAYAGLWMASESVNESQEESPEEAESLALAIRLQQEDDEAQLRATLGLTGSQEDPVSPSSLSYEQLLQLGSTIGTVSKGASSESIRALDRMTVAEARMCKSVILGEQVSLCTAPQVDLVHFRLELY